MDRLGLVVITMSSGAMTEATVDHFATLVGFSGSSSFIECFQSDAKQGLTNPNVKM